MDGWTNEQFCPELTLYIATQVTEYIGLVKPLGQFYPLRLRHMRLWTRCCSRANVGKPRF